MKGWILNPSIPIAVWPLGAPQSWTVDEERDDDYPPDPPKCPDCNGKGVIELFTGVVDCERCDGSGY